MKFSVFLLPLPNNHRVSNKHWLKWCCDRFDIWNSVKFCKLYSCYEMLHEILNIQWRIIWYFILDAGKKVKTQLLKFFFFLGLWNRTLTSLIGYLNLDSSGSLICITLMEDTTFKLLWLSIGSPFDMKYYNISNGKDISSWKFTYACMMF